MRPMQMQVRDTANGYKGNRTEAKKDINLEIKSLLTAEKTLFLDSAAQSQPDLCRLKTSVRSRHNVIAVPTQLIRHFLHIRGCSLRQKE